jgi:hypothetical protein
VWSPVGQPKNTVKKLKTEGTGRRVTAGDGDYCNFRNRTICRVMNMNNKSVKKKEKKSKILLKSAWHRCETYPL